jgi:dihydroorotase-like cyclic amidohydrolase
MTVIPASTKVEVTHGGSGMIERMSLAPARAMRLSGGDLKPGGPADCSISR